MKPLLLMLFSIVTVCLTAQSINDTIQTVFYLPGNVNITVRLLNKNSITGDVWRFTDSSLMMYGRNNKGDMVFKHISYTEMRYVKIKRYAFVKGAATGAGVGSLIGDQIVYNAVDYDIKASAQALALIASAAVIGGVINSAATKKKFKIKGKKKNFEPVFEILMRAQP